MRPASNSTMAAAGAAAGFRNFSSPIPYLFGGLALMLALIATALLIIACSHRKYSSSSSDDDEEKPTKTVDMEDQNQEPKIVVIMPGGSNPTYLAMPVSSTSRTEQSVQK